MFGLMNMEERKKIERVQKKFTRILLKSSTPNKSYIERCNALRIKPLWIRRLISGLCVIHRINHNQNNFLFDPLLFSNFTLRTRGNQLAIRLTRTNTTKRSNFFSTRFKFFWNKLPILLKRIENKFCFRINLIKYMDINTAKKLIRDSFSVSPHLIDENFGPIGI
jgi:hypothetical protein